MLVMEGMCTSCLTNRSHHKLVRYYGILSLLAGSNACIDEQSFVWSLCSFPVTVVLGPRDPMLVAIQLHEIHSQLPYDSLH